MRNVHFGSIVLKKSDLRLSDATIVASGEDPSPNSTSRCFQSSQLGQSEDYPSTSAGADAAVRRNPDFFNTIDPLRTSAPRPRGCSGVVPANTNLCCIHGSGLAPITLQMELHGSVEDNLKAAVRSARRFRSQP